MVRNETTDVWFVTAAQGVNSTCYSLHLLLTNFSLLIDCLIVTLIKLVKFLICPNLNQFCFELILTTLSVNKLHQLSYFTQSKINITLKWLKNLAIKAKSYFICYVLIK